MKVIQALHLIGCSFLTALVLPVQAREQADVNVKHIVDRPELIVEELTGLDVSTAILRILLTLEEIENAELNPEEKLERIAGTAGCAAFALVQMAPDAFRQLSPNLRPERLEVVTAAAVVAAREFSRGIVDGMLEGRVLPAEREAINAAAANPDQYLSRQAIRQVSRCTPAVRPLPIRPEPIRPLPEDPDRQTPTDSRRPTPAPAPRYEGQ